MITINTRKLCFIDQCPKKLCFIEHCPKKVSFFHFSFMTELVVPLLGPRNTRYFCDKKDIFHPIFFSCVNWKYLFLDNYAYWSPVWKDFKLPLLYFEEKISLYQNVCLYLFIAILCAKILCVTWVLHNSILLKIL